ncbi:uncharacterized protein LOC115475651 [Microcaecilia unicolor]|uniref:Uncharacterized protein LOC115475651 n=1 Tax=Microcaecilia unicolor TaxID=1415580 RepID=A0A6P7YIX2_9AMPH|nr:uncharacterized protein LOC115475651 [Microcaecilia unicolor]
MRKFKPTGNIPGSWQWGDFRGKIPGSWHWGEFHGKMPGWQWGVTTGKPSTVEIPESWIKIFANLFPFGMHPDTKLKLNLRLPAGENIEQWLYKFFYTKTSTGEQLTLRPSTIFYLIPPDQVVTEWWMYKTAPDVPTHFVTDGPMGMEFITVFMSNYNEKLQGDYRLLITAYSPSTRVTVIVNNSNFKMDFTVGTRETISVPITVPVELVGSGIFSSSVMVQSDKPITVVSVNYKASSADSTIVYPIQYLGKEYYIVTPSGEPVGNKKEFSVSTYSYPTTIDLYLQGPVTFQRKKYPAGSKLTVTLQPFEAIQIQSPQDLTGTRVMSEMPVAVESGHNCFKNGPGCDHMYQQFQPVSNWGTNFYITSFSFQSKAVVLVTASQNTKLDYKSGSGKGTKDLIPGQVMRFELTGPSVLSLIASAGIQVVYYSTGGIVNGKKFGPFLMDIPDIATYCTSYIIYGQESFDNNYASIIAKASATSGILFDGQPISKIQWKSIPGTDYVVGEIKYGTGSSIHIIQHPMIPFGLLSIGFSDKISYASPVLCTGLTENHIKMASLTTTEEEKLPEPTIPEHGKIPEISFPVPPPDVKIETWMYNIFHTKPGEPKTSWIFKFFNPNIPAAELLKPDVSLKFPPPTDLGLWLYKTLYPNTPTEQLPKLRPSNTHFLVPPSGVVTESWIYKEAKPNLPAQFVTDGPLGMEFITAFMSNSDPNVPGDYQLLVTSPTQDTRVTAWINDSYFKTEIIIGTWDMVAIPISVGIVYGGPGLFGASVIVQSDKPISVFSVNSKDQSADRALVYPIHYLGNEYYIATPSGEETPYTKGFSVITYDYPTTVEMLLRGAVTLQNTNYPAGSKVTRTLQPFEVLQVQSKDDLSGTSIMSEKPVAVLYGHSCYSKNTPCNHMYKQLQPVSNWGTTFCITPLPSLPNDAVVMVISSQKTRLDFTFGGKQGSKDLVPGEVLKFELSGPSALYLNGNAEIQVVEHYTGGVVNGKQFDPFLLDIPDTGSFCTSYIIYGQKSFEYNFVSITAKTSAIFELRLDGKPLNSIQWTPVSGTDYSYGILKFDSGYRFHTLYHPTVPFGLLTFGYASRGLCMGFKESHIKLFPWALSETLNLPIPKIEGPVPEPTPPVKLPEIQFPVPPPDVDKGTWIFNIFHPKTADSSTSWIYELFFPNIPATELLKPDVSLKFPPPTDLGLWLYKTLYPNTPTEQLPKLRPSNTHFLVPPSLVVTESWIYREAKPNLPAQFVSDGPLGMEFITAFMSNSDPNVPGDYQLLVTSPTQDTRVTAWINDSYFKTEIIIGTWDMVAIPISVGIVYGGPGLFGASVIVQSDKPISVFSVNSKGQSADRALVYPIHYLGNEYYIATPSGEETPYTKGFSVITYDYPTTVEMLLRGAVTLQNTNYPAGSKVTRTLQPFEVLQVQSKDDLSGTSIMSEKPVAVLYGHSCSSKNTPCNHMYKQLQPVSNWGTTFCITPLPSLPNDAVVMVISSQKTRLDFTFGGKQGSKDLVPGEVLKFELSGPSALYLNGNAEIQVVEHYTGGVVNGKQFDPFLLDIPDTGSFCTSYIIYGQKSFEYNFVSIIAKTSAIYELRLDGKPLNSIQWTPVSGTDYSYGILKFDSGYRFHTLYHPTVPFGLLTFGYASRGLCMGFKESHIKLFPWALSETLNLPIPKIEGPVPEPTPPVKLPEIQFPVPPPDVDKGTWIFNIFHPKTADSSTSWIYELFFPNIPATELLKPDVSLKFPPPTDLGLWLYKTLYPNTPTEQLPKLRPSNTHFLVPPSLVVTESWIYREAKPNLPAQFVSDGPLGMEFITAFMSNSDPNVPGDYQLLVTSPTQDTRVTAWINDSYFKTEIIIGTWDMVAIPISVGIVYGGPGLFGASVIVQSDKPISVFSVNSKDQSADRALVYPIHYLGNEYYIATPSGEETPYTKGFSVITYDYPTTVEMLLRGAVTLQNTNYPAGSKVTRTLQPFEVLQVQSKDDLSGTSIMSEKPVAVLYGHSCSSKNTPCNHMYKQLQPVSNWGTTFCITPLPSLPNDAVVMVISSQKTRLDFTFGGKQGSKDLVPGEVLKFELSGPSALYINGNAEIQVVEHYTGGVVNGKQFDPFLLDIPDTGSFCTSYIIYGQKSFEYNFVSIIAKTSAIFELRLDGKPLNSIQWTPVSGTDYSYGILKFDSGYRFHTLYHPTVPFGLLTFGYASRGLCMGFKESHIKLFPWALSETLNLPIPKIEGPVPEPTPPVKLPEIQFPVPPPDVDKGTWIFNIFHPKTADSSTSWIYELFFPNIPATELLKPDVSLKFPPPTDLGLWLYKTLYPNTPTEQLPKLRPSNTHFLVPPSLVVTESWIYREAKPNLPAQFVSDGPLGMEFITAFMSNSDPNVPGDYQLLVTSPTQDTRVTAWINDSYFKTEIIIGTWDMVAIPISVGIVYGGPGLFGASVIVQSDKPISVFSVNSKDQSADRALVYPIHYLGNEYYIATPSGEETPYTKGFSVITYDYPTTVEMLLRGAVTLQNTNYPAGSKVTRTLQPFEVLQVQSKDDLSGTSIMSEKPVAVLYGHSCSSKNTPCNHMYKQLQPVSNWGTTFCITPLPSLPNDAVVMVISSQKTRLDFTFGGKQGSKDLVPGEVLKFELSGPSALYLNGNAEIQVVEHYTGGVVNGKQFDPFLLDIPDTGSFCTSYIIYGQKSFEYNFVSITAKTSAIFELRLDGKPLNSIQWTPVSGTDYSYGILKFDSGYRFHTLYHPTVPFGLLTFGYASRGLCMGFKESHIKLFPWALSETLNLPIPKIEGPVPEPTPPVKLPEIQFPVPPPDVDKGTWIFNIFHPKTADSSTSWIYELFFPNIPATELLKPDVSLKFPPPTDLGLWLYKTLYPNTPTEQLPKLRPSNTHFLVPPSLVVTESWIYREAKPNLPAQFVSDGPLGMEFITAFMSNSDPNVPGDYQLLVTSPTQDTRVTAWINDSYFKTEIIIGTWDMVAIPISVGIVYGGPGLFGASVIVQSDKPISVFSVNSKDQSADRALVYPIHYLGNEYYIATPSGEETPYTKGFSVITYDYPPQLKCFFEVQ